MQFELTTLGGADLAARHFPTDSPTFRTLFETGVPTHFLIWVMIADAEVSVYEADGIGPLLKFAHRGRAYFVVEPSDGSAESRSRSRTPNAA